MKNSFNKRLSSMLKVDFRRMFISRLTYIMLAIALVCPVLILVMTTMMDGSTSVNPQTGEVTTIEAFDSVWQAISAPSNAPMGMDLTGMCNMNLMYFAVGVLISLLNAHAHTTFWNLRRLLIRQRKPSGLSNSFWLTFRVNGCLK